MKYFIFPLIALLILSSCKTEKPAPDLSRTNFIYLSNKEFKHRDSTFFPLMLNYPICIRKIGDEYVVSPYHDYEKARHFEGSTKDSALLQVEGHMKLIKEMGFNTVRLAADNMLWEIDDTKKYNIIAFKEDISLEKRRLKNNYDIYFDRIHEITDIAKKLDLRIMYLLTTPIDEEVKNFTKALLKEFSNRPTIFAYDFFNEPLYFDNEELKGSKRKRPKEDAYNIVVEWKEMMDEYAPNQLFTIGFSEPNEVLEWDASILPVDFVAFHTYHPLRVPNEIYWYANYIGKPWMLGETSLPADNDSISFQEQTKFMKETYQRTIDCGGIGFGWWAFQDVNWGAFGHDHTSLLTRKGITWTKDKQHKIIGSLKPAAKIVKTLKNYKPSKDCPCWTNYYNMLGYHNMMIKGKIINGETDKPIEGAVVRGWSKNWKIATQTFTRKDGQFTFYSNTPFVHFEISAPGMTKIKFNQKINYKPKNENVPPMDSLKNQNLEYKNISYKPFLKSDSTGKIFGFKKQDFNQYYYVGEMEAKKLYPLDFVD
ncbi:MAG TPA: hypothetical protein VJ951_14860 [Bacteroidales bacterium]|nr:hypothetical protein [Bacteroidales bacterium]